MRALKNRVKELELEINAQFLAALDEGDSKAATLPDGITLGKVTKTRGRLTPTVIDETAFLRWVQENHPEEIEPQVRPAFRAKIIETTKSYGVAIDPSTCEVVPGVELRTGDPFISFRPARGYQQIVADRWEEIAGPSLLRGGE